MKKALIVSALCICALFVVVPGQAKAADTFRVGIEAAVPIPLLDWGDATGVGFGAFGKFEFYFNPNMGLSARFGYIYHLNKTVLGVDAHSTEMPILIGFKYLTDFGLYGELATGICRYEVVAGGFSGDEWKLGLLLGVGYEIFGLNAGVNLFWPSAGDIDDIMALMFTIGWSFGF
ncbi:MAG: outer membrane beta-barrel protein [Deltaproteobacteria bacterium]|nr:outer membrane beta-barrel protein [Deltaproteobacteria bacterium]